ncbi:MAG: diguanylate cyclase response regulator [Burkholderiales bacterium RIFCSPLOWO2_02_FULL_57_36]|nr:MAG: diguanylate cyclase response regulator [Burkholderiales bacterium RIFCSPLOWO2_02_FULL_57_36]
MADISVQSTYPGSQVTRLKPRVLLVDDQMTIIQIVRGMVGEQPDIEFHYVDSAAAAVQNAIELKPTVILQDLSMPGIDGFELVRQYRAHPETAGVPVIVLSVAEDPKLKARAFDVGANDYVVKLPDRLELLARIRYHSTAYTAGLERDEAFHFLRESQQKLAEANLELRKLAAVDAELQKLAARDALTGLVNRRRFDDVLRAEWPRAQRDKYPVSLLLCNVDLFKLYGESHGAEAGDQCLKKFAAVVTAILKRPADLAGRYGDEFAILLPNTDSQGAMTIAETCRAGMESLQIPSEWSEKNVLTISIGVASMVPNGELGYEELIRVANRALKNAKEQGRNLVRIARHRSITVDDEA